MASFIFDYVYGMCSFQLSSSLIFLNKQSMKYREYNFAIFYEYKCDYIYNNLIREQHRL